MVLLSASDNTAIGDFSKLLNEFGANLQPPISTEEMTAVSDKIAHNNHEALTANNGTGKLPVQKLDISQLDLSGLDLPDYPE